MGEVHKWLCGTGVKLQQPWEQSANRSTGNQKPATNSTVWGCHLAFEYAQNMGTNQWMTDKYYPFWRVLLLFNIKAVKNWFTSQCLRLGLYQSLLHTLSLRLLSTGMDVDIHEIADDRKNAVTFQINLWSAPVAVLHIMYLWTGGWNAARYTSIILTRTFSVSNFHKCGRFTSTPSPMRSVSVFKSTLAAWKDKKSYCEVMLH